MISSISFFLRAQTVNRVMRMRHPCCSISKKFVLISLLAFGFANSAGAWESSRSGPVLTSGAFLDLVNAIKQTKQAHHTIPPRKRKSARAPFVPLSSGTPASPPASPAGSLPFLSRRTVEYPQQSGARLGDGWDFVTNTRMYSQCVEYGVAVSDKFQETTLNYTRAVDDETLSIALNIDTSAHASGGFDGISAHANGSFNLASSFKSTSKDDLIVAHASVVNGASYVAANKDANASTKDPNIVRSTAPSIAGVRLSDAALQVFGQDNDREAFRAACGDGFIAAIGTGADLYLLYHFTHLETDTRLKITTSMEAGGGVSSLFDAGGSMHTTLNYSDLISHDRLGIYFVQSGGKIASLPTKLEDVSDRVSKLPTEAFENGKPLYVIVVPYQELYNWPQALQSSPLVELRTSLARYSRRLRWAFSELQAVIADFRANRSTPEKSEYLHDELHRLRAIDYADLGTQLNDEMKRVDDAITGIDASCAQKNKSQSANGCLTTVTTLPGKNIDFDDFKYLVQLPVPKNTVRDDALKQILDTNGDVSDRRYLLSMELYRHWVERLDQQRCALFSECADHSKRVITYKEITDTFN